MSNDIVPSDAHAPIGASAQVLQKVGVLSAKAALSGIPWAALVFDLGQAAIDFGNARLMDRLLKGLGERIDQMESDARERLKADEIYQLSAQAAIRRMLTETNPRMADALARAVVELGNATLLPTERMEVARALDMLTEPSIHLLQTVYRAQNGMLTRQELNLVEDDATKPEHFTLLAYASMPVISWLGPMNDLQRTGLVETVIDSVWWKEVHDAIRADMGHSVPLPLIYKLGERVVRMCFDDPAVPAFGMFAALPEAGEVPAR
ncbi:hypothetical protein Q8W71_30805 [Methylobacterium sp. NEAU 140]|uniref:hypothetical protein n=1 Tax=Methylobacterium sp. NEAU 140 TaxID=3064945 RepID=UPI0027330291|nr:hypothetical protein [Methylobacterium sp. NEAU 140]MDP4026983.1 hypothetical protein [Methylobacterium sp. NEAU 140]